MSSVTELVKVPRGKGSDTAVLLLAAAEELNLPASVIKMSGGSFLVPPEVEKKAFPPQEPAKKTAAKKSTTPAKAQE